MALIAVSIYVDDPGEVENALSRALRAAERGAQLVEWRVDALAGTPGGHHAAAQLVERSPLPSMITCRSETEGGMFTGDEDERIELLNSILAKKHRPRFVDVEWSAWSAWSAAQRDGLHALLRRDGEDTRLILSNHDMTDRPSDLVRRISRMSAEPACDVIKVAWRARSLRDNLEAFDLLGERNRPMIALCMGEFGLMSRVLQGKFGGFITYASDAPDAETAPGQPTVDELARQYRFSSISKNTCVFGVIGWPVAHSLGPILHNAGFDDIGFNGVYLPLPVPPEWEHFKATLASLLDHTALHFRGASVTMPHKQHLVRFVKERGGRIDSLSERSGAANTLNVLDDGSLECINTDGPAIVSALATELHRPMGDMTGLEVAVLGTGGMSRSAALAMSDAGASVTIISRANERAAEFVQELALAVSNGSIRAGDRATMRDRRFDVVINATPAGMAGGPAPSESPWPADLAFNDTSLVLETVYTPVETPLIQSARTAGVRTIDGMRVFVHQAAMQFEQWTGATLRREM